MWVTHFRGAWSLSRNHLTLPGNALNPSNGNELVTAPVLLGMTTDLKNWGQNLKALIPRAPPSQLPLQELCKAYLINSTVSEYIGNGDLDS